MEGRLVFEPRNYIHRNSNCLTLGCGGSLVVQFTDNVVIDQPGPACLATS